MKALNYIAQTFASLIYTPIYTGLLYLIIVFPMIWVLSLSFWKMLIVFIFLGWILEACITGIVTLCTIPYTWIVKKNKVALFISITLGVLLPMYNIFRLWRELYGHSAWTLVLLILISGMMLQYVFATTTTIYGMYKESSSEE